MSLLEVRDVRRTFGGVVALDRVTFAVEAGQTKAVIGPNGAGKTTLFNVVSGILKPSSGSVRFADRTITGFRPHAIAALGLSRTFQNLNLFSHMTVLENVMVGHHVRTRCGLFSAALRLPGQRAEERRIRRLAQEKLEFVGLPEFADLPVSALSFGQRRMVELARALATQPMLILLDEPASGLNTRETADLALLIRCIRDSGVTVLLVEHDMSLVMEISDSILVLHFGTPIAEGAPAVIRNDPRVVEVYLGGEFGNDSGS
jgi:branched-chain amino acid transport system ATP-binding protein